MHLLVGLLCLALITLPLAEFFVVFLLPRRVKRDPAIARGLLRTMWLPWRATARRLPPVAADTMLGIFGPLGLLAILAMLSVGVILCFAGMYWGARVHLPGHPTAGIGQCLYLSAASFFSASTPSGPAGALGEILQIAGAASGFAVLFIAIGYLPALFQAFSRREAAVSRLDPRAGSPPTAGALLARSGSTGGWRELDAYLREWEGWTAELMETHLSYPILGFFRSQHVNQNWLAALTTVVDACSYAIAYGPADEVEGAALTFRIGRHALADLAHTLSPRRVNNAQPRPRLTAEGLDELRNRLEGTGLHAQDSDDGRQRLEHLRESYEHFAAALSAQLALPLPDWLPSDDVRENWRAASAARGRRERLLP